MQGGVVRNCSVLGPAKLCSGAQDGVQAALCAKGRVPDHLARGAPQQLMVAANEPVD
jgi:hypothetical protein